jgi:alkylation response protein AidB-like acyl-CoA dehydrogenase
MTNDLHTTGRSEAKSPTLDQFLREAKRFLDERAKPVDSTGAQWGEGSDRVALQIVGNKPVAQDDADCAATKAWRTSLWDGGVGWLQGPEWLGGRALPVEYERAFRALQGGYDVPDATYTRVGTTIVGPSILKFGTPEVQQEFLPDIHSGNRIMCQLLSEPEAGSDLANTKTRATRDGDGWRISGQKVWTSGARHADIGECLAATGEPDARHQGLTVFLVDMHAPGVEVRPLRQMTGGAEFGEVFLTDVWVADAHRLGGIGEGWAVVIDTLMNERAAIGDDLLPDDSLVTRLIEVAWHTGRSSDPLIRQELADVVLRMRVLRMTSDRILGALAPGEPPGADLTMVKLAVTDNLARIGQLVGRLLGPAMTADSGEWGTYAWAEFVLGVPGMKIGGGTDEILKNTIGERVLGLPREPKPV